MKKLITLLLAVVLLTPIVKAAELNVKTLEIKNDNGTLKYTGTTDEGVLAVSCSLFNSKDEEIDISSNAVSNNKFEGTFTVTKGDTYTVKCANYEGGKIVSAKESIKNPKTGDNIIKYVTILGVSILGITGITVYNKKQKNAKKD